MADKWYDYKKKTKNKKNKKNKKKKKTSLALKTIEALKPGVHDRN